MSTPKRGTPPRYDAAFKEGAVKLVTEQGRQATDVAKELGVSADSLRSWLKAAGVNTADVNRSNKDTKRIRELEAQVRELKKQVTDKDAAIDVLKKSVGILSKPSTAGRRPPFERLFCGAKKCERISIFLLKMIFPGSLRRNYAVFFKLPGVLITYG